MVDFSNSQRSRFLLAYMGETSLGFQVQSTRSGEFVISSIDKFSPACRAGLKVGDKCQSYYADRTDDEDIEWESDTLNQLEQMAVPRVDTRGVIRQRCVVIIVGHSKADTRRTNFCNDNKRCHNFEDQLETFEIRSLKRCLSATNAPKSKKTKLTVNSDDEDQKEEAQEHFNNNSEKEVVKEKSFQELSDRLNKSTDPAAASVIILDKLDFDPIARVNLKALAVSLLKELDQFLADEDGQDSNSDDTDMVQSTALVANLETLYMRLDETGVLCDETAEGLKPEQMTAEHVNICSDLVNRCNEVIMASITLLLKTSVSKTEQERRLPEAQARQQNQSRQLEEILTQCTQNVDECSAMVEQATTNTEAMLISVREKTETFLTMASRDSRDAVNHASDLLRTSKTLERADKEELSRAEHVFELAEKVSTHFHQALTVRSDLQKYTQRTKMALAECVFVLANTLRDFFWAAFLQQQQNAKELDEKHDELKELLRKYGSTRGTRQRFLESEISDIQAGMDGLQKQRIQTMWTQQKMWDSRSLKVLTPTVKFLLEWCYRDILDMLMKSGDDRPEWKKIHKSLDQVFFQNEGEDTDEEEFIV